VGFNLWWAQNDGMSGHAWLSPADMHALRGEMLAQGMAWEGAERPQGAGIPAAKLDSSDGATISSREIEGALQTANPVPATAVSPELWRDWLDFLEGARTRGGILVQK